MPRQYVTTAIDYPNAAPHMGHVLEKVLADVSVRWMRLRGDDVRFQIGTDEHGIKIQQTAQKEGVTPKQLVDRNVPLFRELYTRLGISFDVFIRTSDQTVHWPTVIALWKRLEKAGVLEKHTYTGLYCSGCERFITKKELVDGLCPDHKIPPQEVKEENWFFRLSAEATWLKKTLKEGYRIVPEFRAKETLALIEQGLEDVSFSRPKSSLSWGVPVPGDEKQVMYVWCDALTNYISGLGLLTDHAESDWWDAATVTHVIGKDIARFHALIWPAMLKHADVRVPDRLLIHGFLTSEGQKMSKSIGNVVVPEEAIAKYGIDPLRFYLSHEIPVGNDGDFSWKRFGELYDSKLRNQIGNLLNRVLTLLKKDGNDLTLPSMGEAKEPIYTSGGRNLLHVADAAWVQFAEAMDRFEISVALQAVMDLTDFANKYMNDAKPWTIKEDPVLRKKVLSGLAELLRHITLMLLPIIPETAGRMAGQLGLPFVEEMKERSFVITPELRTWAGAVQWRGVGEPEILFPSLV